MGASFKAGWVTGFVVNFVGCWWWTPTLMRFADLPIPVALLGAMLLCAYHGLQLGIWAGLTRLVVGRRERIPWLVAAPVVAMVSSSFPPPLFEWDLAILWWRLWPLIQVAEWGGTSAVVALIVLANVIVGECFVAWRNGVALYRLTGLALAVFGLVQASGLIRAYQVMRSMESAQTIRVGIVEPGFGHLTLSERQERAQEYVEVLRKGTKDLADMGADLVVWPEAVWPYRMDRAATRIFSEHHPWAQRRGTNVPILFGTLTHEIGTERVWNSAVLVGESGEILGRYDKVQLVPVAETPFAETRFPRASEKIRRRLPDAPVLAYGRRVETIPFGSIVIAPAICSEDLDKDHIMKMSRLIPDVYIALVSDSWFHSPSESLQHLAAATFRAIETRRPWIRATHGGGSGMVDPIGRAGLIQEAREMPNTSLRTVPIL